MLVEPNHRDAYDQAGMARAASKALTEAPVPLPVKEEVVPSIFMQREPDRAEQQWLRRCAQQPVPGPYDLHSL